MQIKVSNLAANSIFTFMGKTYKKGVKACNGEGLRTIYKQPYMGEQDDAAPTREIYPKFGGQFQEDVPLWINSNTLVTVIQE